MARMDTTTLRKRVLVMKNLFREQLLNSVKKTYISTMPVSAQR
jgi:hypothetical protein